MNYKFESTIDNTGRFVISRKILKDLGWDGITKVSVEVEDNKVIITRSEINDIAKCKKCGKKLQENFKYCPYCGEENNEN